MNSSQSLETSYSKILLKLCQQIKEARTYEEKAQRMLQLAARYHAEHDLTESELNDSYHDYFEQYEQARLAFQQTAFRLARLAMNEVHGAFEDGRLGHEEGVETDKVTN